MVFVTLEKIPMAVLISLLIITYITLKYCKSSFLPIKKEWRPILARNNSLEKEQLDNQTLNTLLKKSNITYLLPV